ncbi:MAG: hypothetical protein K6A23_14120, partial [Butyrivibrio sp.]|nr:hypothetical protein [Butyrivibrio sp.]
FKRIREIEKIEFEGEVLYTAFFGLSGLTDDETAIARLMKETAEYALGRKDSPYEIKEALWDSYVALKMQESEDKGVCVLSENMPWMKVLS